MTTVYVCSNRTCGAVFAHELPGHCPICVEENGVGWSTMPRKVLRLVPEDASVSEPSRSDAPNTHIETT